MKGAYAEWVASLLQSNHKGSLWNQKTARTIIVMTATTLILRSHRDYKEYNIYNIYISPKWANVTMQKKAYLEFIFKGKNMEKYAFYFAQTSTCCLIVFNLCEQKVPTPYIPYCIAEKKYE